MMLVRKRVRAGRRSLFQSLESRVLLSTVFVDANAPGTVQDGMSWETAYTDLQAALTPATSGTEIRVADGTYKPTSDSNSSIYFVLKNGVSLMGGYAGYGAAVPDARDVAANSTLLSGDIGSVGSSADNSFHVVVGSGTNSSALLDGFTITKGMAEGSFNDWGRGGGMYNNGGSPTINSCTFSENTALLGGGIFNTANSRPTLTNCVFSKNMAYSALLGGSGSGGGGMFNEASSPILTNCIFNRNTVSYTFLSGGSENGGGGMYNSFSSSPKLTNCTFIGNTVSLTFNSNSSFANGGGGIYNSGSSPTLTNCTFSGNTTSITPNSGSPTSNGGGGMYNSSASPTLTNCIFAGDQSTAGGAMYNSATSSSLRLTNCIVWGCGGNPIFNSSTSPTITYSDIQGGYTGVGNINSDPRFVRSPWTGPDGVFTTADDDYGDLRLRTGSPAINAGLNSAIPAGITTDLAGNPRVQNGTVDMGAYEGAVALPAATLVYVDLNAPIGGDGTSWALAYRDLQTALAATPANSNTEIHVADGTYKPTSGTDRSISFALKSGVSLFGGFAGYGAVDPDARDLAVNQSILSGNIRSLGSSFDNSFHVVVARATDSTAILDGFTISGGAANDSSEPQYSGGGMYCDAGVPTVRNCIFTANQAYQGAGLYLTNSASVVLINCSFNGNTASAVGGGMYITNSSSPFLNNCTFIANTATTSGGAVYNDSAVTPWLDNCTFRLNTANTGGGIHNSSAWNQTLLRWIYPSLLVTNCTFSGNTANSSGGGMYSYQFASSTLINCVFTGNTSFGEGGGLSNSSSSPTLINCSFSANMALYGGAIYNGSSSTRLTNCIVWGCGSSPIYNYASSAPVITRSDIQGGYPGTGNLNADPQFVRSPWAGSDGAFGTADDDYGDLRLRTGSAALNTGTNTIVNSAGTTTDIAGNSRIQNVTVDMGAYEGSFTAAAPKLIYVDINALGANNGTSWTDAFVSLSAAIQTAIDGDTIRIADGTYKPTTGTDRTQSFALKSRVALLGGYAGYGAADPNAQDIPALLTILSGDIGVTSTNTDNSYHVVTATGISGATVDRITVTSGCARGNGRDQDKGAGLFTSSSAVTLSNCTFSGNTTFGNGGGIYNSSSSLTLTNCIVSQNSDSGMLTYSCSLTLTNCTFSGNSGAGMVNISSTGTLNNCTFSGNTGAGMANSSALTLTNCTFSGNSGSGMSNSYNPSPTLINCRFIGNTASNGGGMYNYESSPTLINCTFVGNAATNGGAIYNDFAASPTLTNCVLSGNFASSSGGGMYNSSLSTLTNCIVWGCGANPIYNKLNPATITYSDIQGGASGVGNINSEPKFVRSPWAGPDGIVATADDDYGDLRLQVGSPALNAGLNSAIPAGVTTDLAGNPRIQSGTVDMGAYEGAIALPAPTLVFVDLNAPMGGDGTSWATAYVDLQTALAFASSGTEIRVADGTYRPTSNTDRTVSFVLKNGVSVRGGYAGYGAPNPDARDVAGNKSILSGNIGSASSSLDNSYHVVIGSATNSTAILDGFTITAGMADGSSTSQFGGGMYCIAGMPIVSNCSFTGNQANLGGGIYLGNNASPVLTNCVFSANTASSFGGAIYSDCSLPPSLAYCTFSANTASTSGGAIYNAASLSTVSCTFSGNTANDGGGIYSASFSLLMLSHCALSGNTASNSGGGVYNYRTTSSIFTNCAFTGNKAAAGAGMYNINSMPTLANCTFSGNTPGQFGGAVANLESSPTITNCIIWGSGVSPIANFDVSSKPTVTYSDIQGGYVGVGNMSLDPLFVDADGADNIYGTADDDLRLQPSSPCIDAGSNAAVPASVTTDLEGNVRFIDIPGLRDPGAIVDIGAYERQLPLSASLGTLILNAAAPSVQFSVNNVLAASSVAVGNVRVQTVLGDGSLGATVGVLSASYDPTSKTVRFTLPIDLADGNYRATLLAGSVSDTYGVSLTSDSSFDFFMLAGDADHDRDVDLNDLRAMTSNWGQSNKTFGQGDFNYDGIVNDIDLGILARHWQQTLTAPSPALPASLPARTPTRTPVRRTALTELA